MDLNLTRLEKALYDEANIATQPLMHISPRRIMDMLITISDARNELERAPDRHEDTEPVGE